MLTACSSGQQSTVKAHIDKLHAECSQWSSESAKNITEAHKDLAQQIKQLQDLVKCSTGSEHKPTVEDNQILTEFRISLSKLAKISNTISPENLRLKRLYFDSMHRREDSVEDPQGGSFGVDA
jgi:predicted HAD superfamily Cof-like phosphohydrolase